MALRECGIRVMFGSGFLEADWRREALRTNLWFVPLLETVATSLLFVATYTADSAAAQGRIHFPSWVLNGTADTARVILISVSAAIITVVGIVFSITIVVLTLASTQFKPRMLRNCVRDVGTQLALGAFVATFCYTMITLVSVGGGDDKVDFVAHLSITVALILTIADVGVLVYFLNHVASMIQLPVVIAGVAKTLHAEIDAQNRGGLPPGKQDRGLPCEALLAQLADSGAAIQTPRSGYLQVIRMDALVKVA